MNHFMLVFFGFQCRVCVFPGMRFSFSERWSTSPYDMSIPQPYDDFDDMTNRNEQFENSSPHNPTIPPSNNPSLRNFVFFGSRL